MNFSEMTTEALLERRTAIASELEADGADLEALEAEVRGINEELEKRRADAAKREELRKSVAEGFGDILHTFGEGQVPDKSLDEVRKSDRYIEAYAKYIQTGNAAECRAILTETNPSSVSGSGPVPVPELVDEIVRTAWDNDQILSRVTRTYIRGNLKVAFERSADAAVVHTEGTTAPSEESLVLGIVTMIPKNVKKYVRISDEAAAMGGEAFLRYVYDELTYKIVKKLSDLVVDDIKGASASHGSDAVGIPQVTAAPAYGTIASAIGYLSDEAREPVVIMNRITWSAFKTAAYAGNFAADIFEGLTVVFSDEYPAYATANDNAVYASVGDLRGAQVNYPEGDGVVIKYDDLSEAEDDMIKIVGRQYAAHAVVAPGRFVNILKPAAATT